MKLKAFKFSIVDIAVIVCIIAAISVFVSRINSVLEYRWAWSSIPSYFIITDPVSGSVKANILLQGFLTTIKLSAWSGLLAFFIGTLSGIMGAKGNSGQRFLSRLYVETIRNIPSLVLVIIFYYFVSSQLRINSFISAVIALGLYEGAYVSEIVRGGVLSISRGQWEASFSVGLSSAKTFRLVILPQAFRITAFPLAGQFISTIKDSAIVSVISIQELTFQGMELMAATFLTFEIWITITILYFILTFFISTLVNFLEKKYALKT